MFHKILKVIVPLSLLLLQACSDNSDISSTEQENTNAGTTESSKTYFTDEGYEIGQCQPVFYGLKIFVPEENAFYICANNNRWIKVRVNDDYEEPASSSSAWVEEFPVDSVHIIIDTLPYSSSSAVCDLYWNSNYDDYIYAYPNDKANNDSASHRLADGGVFLNILQGGSYSVRFQKGSDTIAPELSLYHYSTYTTTIQAQDSIDYWYFPIDAENLKSSDFYKTRLHNKDCSFYKEPTKGFLFEGSGKYSSHFNINLIVIGKYMGTSDKASETTLAETIKARMNEALNNGGVFVDKIAVLHAHEHELHGQMFPEDSAYVLPYGRVFANYSLLEKWNGHENALNLMLGYYIDRPNILGFAPRFGGHLDASIPNYSYVVLGTHNRVTGKPTAQSSNDIAETAVHEAGHFLGLRHTSSSKNDMEGDLDKSNVEDGLEDTPYCAKVNTSENIDNCPDRRNIIFPYSSDKTERTYSGEQVEQIRKNLTLMVH